MKKILVGVLLCSILIPQSFAAVTSEIDSANFLATKGIINDNSKNVSNYRLGSTITREEVLKIIMKLSGKPISEMCRGEFTDVSKSGWGCKYIEAALDAGYIAKNTTFRPNDEITKTEAMKLVLKAKSISKIQDTENWQEDYMNTAFQYQIIETKYSDYNALATRGWIFQVTTSTIEKEAEIKIKIREKLMSDEALKK